MNTAPPWAQDLALLGLRLTFGGLMLLEHGLGKLDRLTGGGTIKFADPFGLGPELSLGLVTFAEVACAGLLVLGLFTRAAALPLVVAMTVAAFWAHGGDPLSDREPALMYLAAYLALFVFGGGRFSLQVAVHRWLPKNRFVAFLLG